MKYPAFHVVSSMFLTSLLFTVPIFSSEHDHGAHSSPGMAPEAVLQELKAGNHRFIEDKALHTHQDSSRRRELASGQKPKAIVLSCSDSRVPPELVFDQGLGDIFTVRVAGNILGAATVASIEYAVEHLGAGLIIVMGHESCGAVKAALSTPVGKSTGSWDLDNLISSIQSNLEPTKGGKKQHKEAARSLASGDKTFRTPAMKNVEAVTKSLTRRSKVIREAVEAGMVRIAPAIYGLDSGKVDFF